MARFGQGLIQALTNPAYADQLSTVGMMAGSLKGRRDAEEEEKAKLAQQRAAQSSVYAMMNQGNVNDPNVANSVLEVANSQGLDLEAVQKSLLQAQKFQEQKAQNDVANRTAQERLAMERERLEMARAEAKYKAADQAWQTEQRRIQEERVKVTSVLEGALKQGSDIDRVLDQLPEEHRAFAREQVTALEEFNQGKQERADKAALRVPLTEEQLSEYEGVVGKEAVNAYRRGVAGDIPVKARMTLENLYNDVIKADLTSKNSAKAEALKPPTAQDRELAQAAIDKAFAGSGLRGFFWSGQKETMSSDDRELFVQAVASKLRTNPDWVANKENLEAYWKGINNEEAAPQTGTPKPDWVSQEDWDAMSDEEKGLFQ